MAGHVTSDEESTTETIATIIRVSSASATEDSDNSDSGTGNQNSVRSDGGALIGIVYGVIGVVLFGVQQVELVVISFDMV